jgi:PAS domain S-box-containing protein
MQVSPFEPFALISSLTYFSLGLAVFVRAVAYPESQFRQRLVALGAFGLLEAGAIWIPLSGALSVPPDLRVLLSVPSFLALYYFAFGWSSERPGLAHGLALGSLAAMLVVLLGVVETNYLALALRFGIALPASLCAALVFFSDEAFEARGHSSSAIRTTAALGFVAFGVLQFVSDVTAVEFLAQSVGSADVATLGATVSLILGVVMIVIMMSVVVLLNRLDVGMRQEAAARIAEAEAILAKGEARLNRALGFASVGCWEWNITDDHVEWSDQMYRIYGFAAQEFSVTYSDLLEHIHSADRPAVEQAIARVVKQELPYEMDHRVVRSDGSVRYVRAHCEGEHRPGTNARRLIGTMSDITDLVEAKNAAEKARSAAEAASIAKSNFMANMSHELRTPLNAIIGFSEILEKELFGPHANPLYKNYATDIQKGGQRLLSTINDILTVSRFEAGNIALEEEAAINVEELLRKCARCVEEAVEKGKVILRTSIAGDLPALRGDPRLLAQAFLNLFSNAVKFTPKDGIVEIGAMTNRVGGLNVWVRDTGIGMTAEQIAHIGEPFLQFDDTRNRKFEGAGLGLRIAKQILELHTAEIEIQSEPGKGTLFSINLPPGRSVRKKAPRLRAWG